MTGLTVNRKIFNRFFVGVLFLLLLIEIVIVAPKQVGTIDDLSPVNKSKKTTSDSEQVLQGVKLMETKEGAKEWELLAEKALSLKEQGLWKLEKVDAVFWGKNNLSFHVIGKTGTVVVGTKNMTIEGDVVATSSNGYDFQTEKIHYDSVKGKLETDTKVAMKSAPEKNGNRIELQGVGMQAILDSGEMRLSSDVVGSKKLSDGRQVNIKSGSATFLGKEKSAHFQDGVTIDLGDSRITGPQARFEYDSEKQLIKTLSVDGGAQVSDAEKWATAQKVLMQLDNDKLILSGAPRVVQENGELVGDEIVFANGGKQIQVNRGRARIEGNSGDTQ